MCHTLNKVQVNLPEKKNIRIYLNRSGKLFPPELHLMLPETYLKISGISMAELLPELS